MDNQFGYNSSLQFQPQTSAPSLQNPTSGISFSTIAGRGTTSVAQDLSASGAIKTTTTFKQFVYTFATLPSTPTAGTSALVSDAGALTYGTIAASGGANFARITYDGTNWRYL